MFYCLLRKYKIYFNLIIILTSKLLVCSNEGFNKAYNKNK